MVSLFDASHLGLWVLVFAGLVFFVIWYWQPERKIRKENRSIRSEDVQVDESILTEDETGLLIALRQFAQHMKIVYGLEVKVEPRDRHQVEEIGQRILLFEVVQDLLLYMARCTNLARVHIIIDRQNDYHLVYLNTEGEVNFDFSSKSVMDNESYEYDILKHIEERLYQVEGHLKIAPNRKHANRITLKTAVEKV